MIRVVRIFEIDEQWIKNGIENGGSWELGPGLLIWLDAEDAVEPGSTIRVHRPDGTSIDRVVKGASPGGEPVAPFLSKTRQHEIPDGSEIELPPF
jgi:hypothetical protein